MLDRGYVLWEGWKFVAGVKIAENLYQKREDKNNRERRV